MENSESETIKGAVVIAKSKRAIQEMVDTLKALGHTYEEVEALIQGYVQLPPEMNPLLMLWSKQAYEGKLV